MTASDANRRDPHRDEVIAGEYVLGALSPEDRRKVERRLAEDRRFAAMVNRWERNLAEEKEPARPPYLQAKGTACDVRLKGTVAGGLWNSLAFWRALALALLALVATLAASPRPAPPAPEPAAQDPALP